jgi:hypothetical protein
MRFGLGVIRYKAWHSWALMNDSAVSHYQSEKHAQLKARAPCDICARARVLSRAARVLSRACACVHARACASVRVRACACMRDIC